MDIKNSCQMLGLKITLFKIIINLLNLWYVINNHLLTNANIKYTIKDFLILFLYLTALKHNKMQQKTNYFNIRKKAN